MKLTPRHRQIADLLVEGRTDKEIAKALGIAPGTVKAYCDQMLRTNGHKRRMSFASAYAVHKAMEGLRGQRVLDLSKDFGVPVC